jgi:peptidoglycan/xylan/chitin deacetylase (PgdA/CDA1 family)
MRGLTVRVAVALVSAGVLAGCALPGARPAPATPWPSTGDSAGSGGGGFTMPSDPPSPSQSDSPSPAPSATHSSPPSSPPSPPKKPVAPAGLRLGGPGGSAWKVKSDGVALTFDDGPDPVQTPRMLALLAQQHVKATFCLIGKNVEANPDIVRQIVAAGHRICNHSYAHSETLGKQTPDEIRADLQRTNDAIHQAAPAAKITYFRAPGGNFTPEMVQIAADLNMKSIYWYVDPRDWDHPAGETSAAHQSRVITQIRQHAAPGAIILSHDRNGADTVAAYTTLIPWLKQHYGVVPLP